SQRHGIQPVPLTDEIAHHAGAGSILPSAVSGSLLERIDVSHTVGVAVTAPEDNQIGGDDRVSVKLRAPPTVLKSVVLPAGLASPPIDGMDDTVTGTDDREVARDCGRREHSATGLVLPQNATPDGSGCLASMLRP